MENSVIFVSPPKPDQSNQAITVKEDDDTHQALKLLGQSIGIIALGRKIVLIEGEHGSLDKQTYGAILRNAFPNLVLVPSGGRDVIESFSSLLDKVLNKSVWGVEFYILCDGDTAVRLGSEATIDGAADGRLKLLPRYHLENYFLDQHVIAEVFCSLEPEDSWLRSPEQIQAKLRDIARSRIPYATALIVCSRLRRLTGNIDLMPSGLTEISVEDLISKLQERAVAELRRIENTVTPDEIRRIATEVAITLEQSFEGESDDWKRVIPGRAVLRIFCSRAKFDFGRFKMAYIRTAEAAGASPFQEVYSIFESFSRTNAADISGPAAQLEEASDAPETDTP